MERIEQRPDAWRRNPWRQSFMIGLIVAILRYGLDAVADEMVIGDGLFAAVKTVIMVACVARLLMFLGERLEQRKSRHDEPPA